MRNFRQLYLEEMLRGCLCHQILLQCSMDVKFILGFIFEVVFWIKALVT